MNDATDDRSGQDLDVWGGEVTRPSRLPTPDGGWLCILQEVQGVCPSGCTECVEFELGRALPSPAASD